MPGPSNEEPHWYACITRSRHEKKVERLLRERGVESFLPLASRVRQWADRRKRVDFVLFPGYIFVRSPHYQISHVLSVPGVASVVRSNGRAVAIPDEEIDNVRRLAEGFGRSAAEPETVALPEEGARVRIISGPFQGVEGIVTERRGGRRVLVGLPVIGQAVPVDIDVAAVELRP